MPSAAAHLGGANYINQKLNLNSDEFLIGAILPDIIDMDKTKSHYKIQGTYYLVPDLEYYSKHNDLSNMLNLGYYFHLYLDYYFLEDYLEYNTKRRDVFDSKDIYKDYDILNKKINDYFNLDVKHITKLLSEYDDGNINKKKLDTNIRCINCDLKGDLIILDEKKFIKFIKVTSDKFIEDMKI